MSFVISVICVCQIISYKTLFTWYFFARYKYNYDMNKYCSEPSSFVHNMLRCWFYNYTKVLLTCQDFFSSKTLDEFCEECGLIVFKTLV